MEIPKFMKTKEWAVFMNVMRIVTFLMIGFLIFYIIKEVEAVKLLNYDVCKICMNKTGATCYLPPKI